MPQLDSDVRIVQQIEDARFADGERVPVIRITFMVGKHGPFVERFDKETFDADQRNDRINRFARNVRTEDRPR